MRRRDGELRVVAGAGGDVVGMLVLMGAWCGGGILGVLRVLCC